MSRFTILHNLLMFLSIPTLNSGSLWNFMVLWNLFGAQISLNLYSTICNLGIRTNNYVHGVTAWGCSEYIFLDKINASLCMNQQSQPSLQHHQVMDSILHTFCADFHTLTFLVILVDIEILFMGTTFVYALSMHSMICNLVIKRLKGCNYPRTKHQFWW